MSSTIKKNLIGQRFGMLEVIDQKRENNRTWCLCKCDCSNVKWIRADRLTTKNRPTRSCGCESKANQFVAKDLTGQKFGRLTVVRPTEKRDPSNGAVIWECRCECGNLTTATAGDLRKKKSCGCLFEETKEETYKKFAKAHQEKNIIEHVNISAINYPKLRANNTSGVTGVYWSKRNRRWTAQIWVKGDVISLGSYIHKEDAIKARQEAEDKYYRTFLEEHGIEVKFDKKEALKDEKRDNRKVEK